MLNNLKISMNPDNRSTLLHLFDWIIPIWIAYQSTSGFSFQVSILFPCKFTNTIQYMHIYWSWSNFNNFSLFWTIMNNYFCFLILTTKQWESVLGLLPYLKAQLVANFLINVMKNVVSYINSMCWEPLILLIFNMFSK